MKWNHKMKIWPYLTWTSESRSICSIIDLIQPTRREWVMIIIIAVLSFTTIQYRSIANDNQHNFMMTYHQTVGILDSVKTFTKKADKLSSLTATSLSIDESTKLKLVEYSKDMQDLILEMVRSIDRIVDR